MSPSGVMKSASMLDDSWFLQTLRESLGASYPGFASEEAASDPLRALEEYQSILYSLGKQDLVLILEIIQALSHTPSPRLALHALVRRLKEVLAVSHCSLILVDAARREATVIISHEDPDFAGVRISLGHYPEILKSLRTGKITIVKNPGLDPLMHTLKKEQIGKIKDVSIMVLPLIFRDQAFGSLLVRKQRSKEGFILREVRVCQLMVNLVIRALQRMCGQTAPGPLAETAGERGALPWFMPAGGAGLAENLLPSLPIGVLLVDAGNRILMANQRAGEITGFSIQQLLERGFSDIVADERLQEIRSMRKGAASGSLDLDRYHVSYQPPGGLAKTLSFERHPLPGEAALSWVFFRDVSKEKEMEGSLESQASRLREANDSLRQTNERLDELNRMKTHFLAVATHEIRTPLSVVIGYNQFLLQEKAGRLQPAQRKILEESIQGCERLLGIVNEMLDFSRIETGHLKLQLKDQDALLLLKRVYRQMKIIADRADIRLRLELPAKPVRCSHDPDRLEQVLVNLISNSIKFTAAGGEITLAARRKRENRDSFLEFRVTDNGRGLSRELLERILSSSQPLVGHDQTGSQKKGVGLGLAISRRILETHGCRLWAVSEEGRGATFGFSLPLAGTPKPGGERGRGRDDK